MKVYPDDVLTRNLVKEIQQAESYIQEYRNAKGCLYWIFVLNKSELVDVHIRLKRLRTELAYLTAN
jgi:hypothetical protein